MAYIVSTCEVSKFDKSNEVNDVQFKNIYLISVRDVVSKCEKSNDVISMQPRNISCILLVFEVLKFDKFIEVKDEHS